MTQSTESLPSLTDIAELAGEPERALSYLTPEDTWLQTLVDRPVDEEWLEEANLLIALGSEDLSHVSDKQKIEQVVGARERFFEVMIGTAREEHALFTSYNAFVSRRQSLINLDRFVATMRVLHKIDAKAQKVLKNYFDIILMRPETLQAKIDNFKLLDINATRVLENFGVVTKLDIKTTKKRVDVIAAQGLSIGRVTENYGRILTIPEDALCQRVTSFKAMVGAPAIAIIEAFPSLLGKDPEIVARRVRTLTSVITTMGWNIDIIELLTKAPSLLSTSTEKLFAHIGLISKFKKQDLNASSLGALIREPLESHIIAAEFIEPGEYSLAAVKRVIKTVPKYRRVAQAQNLMQNEDYAQVIGLTAYRNYQKYLAAQSAKIRKAA